MRRIGCNSGLGSTWQRLGTRAGGQLLAVGHAERVKSVRLGAADFRGETHTGKGALRSGVWSEATGGLADVAGGMRRPLFLFFQHLVKALPDKHPHLGMLGSFLSACSSWRR